VGTGEDFGTDGLRHAPRRGPTAVAVREGGQPPLSQPGQEAAQMAEGQAQEQRRIPGAKTAVRNANE
jgi:hypothetical protein